MRLFFALPPDPQSLLAITLWRDRALPPLDQPVHVSNFHITLAFLGELKPWQIEPLLIRASEVGFSPFSLMLDEMGYWPKPGVAWLGASRQPDSLTTLANKLNLIAGALNLQTEKRAYKAHLTFARKIKHPLPAPTLAPEFNLSFDHYVLMQTQQGKQGVSYEIVETFQ